MVCRGAATKLRDYWLGFREIAAGFLTGTLGFAFGAAAFVCLIIFFWIASSSVKLTQASFRILAQRSCRHS